MKKLVCGMMMLGLLGVTANASVIAYDTFSYPDGSLVPNGGWANHSGTTGDLQVVSGQAVVQHGVPSEDVHLAFAPVAGKIWYGLDFSVDSNAGTFGSDFEYFAHFTDGGTFNFRGRLDIVAPGGGGDFSVGLSTLGSTADATWGTDLDFDTVYRAIVSFDQDANIAQLWIDAALESDTSILGTDQPDPGASILWMALRQSDSDLNETIRVDNLVVGTSFGDVLVVPEPGTLALLALGSLLMIRRRRG